MSFLATALNCFTTQSVSTRATLPATSANWIVNPATHANLSIEVKGNIATGKVRYAGVDSLPTDPTAAIYAKIDVAVLVSHTELIPLIKLNVDNQSHKDTWSLIVDTPDRSNVPVSIVRPGIDVDVLVTILSGAPEPPSYDAIVTAGAGADEKKKPLEIVAITGSAFESVTVNSVNLAHCIEGSSDGGQDSQAAMIKFPGTFTTVPKAAMYTFTIETVNGTVSLNPARPWSIGRKLLVKTVNGNIDVSGPLHVQFPTDDTFVHLETVNGNIKAQIVGAYKVKAESVNGSVLVRTDGVQSVMAESVNGSTTVRAKGVSLGGNVKGESVNGSATVYASVDLAVDQVTLVASATLGSMLAESKADGWPARSEKSKSAFLGKEAKLDLKRVGASDGEKEKEPVKVSGEAGCGSVKVTLVNAEDAWSL